MKRSVLAISMTSVRPSSVCLYVTLVDYDHVKRQECKWHMTGQCLGYPHAEADPDHNILSSKIPLWSFGLGDMRITACISRYLSIC